MLLNQNDVAVDEELEQVTITIDSSTETDFGDYESGYEYSSGETTKYRNLQWNRGVSAAWINAYCSECWNLSEIKLFLMKFDEI